MLPYKTLITIDRDTKIPVYIQICNHFINIISKGILTPSSKLPSSRELATLLGINRNTINQAYEELISQGWTISLDRKGIFVIDNLPEVAISSHRNQETIAEGSFRWNKPAFPNPNFYPNFKTSLAIDDGFPDVRLTPIDIFMREYRSIAKAQYNRSFLKYGNPQGSENLRQEICRYLSESRGLNTQPNQLLITKGSQMGIYLLAQLLLKKGDTVAVGMSNYFAADTTFRHSGANLLRIPVDEDGMDIDFLEQALHHQTIKAVYIIPHHHWPTTVTLNMKRRLKLLQLAQKYRFAIIEDDYDYDFHYRSKPHLPIASIDHSQNVLYIGSLCKTFAPSIRLGFLTGPADFIQEATYRRRLIDIQGDTVLEEAMAAMIKSGELNRHFRKSVKLYKERRNLFCEILERDFKDSIHFKVPEGGMAVWSRFDKKIDLNKLTATMTQKGVSMLAPSSYQNDSFKENAMRLGFASLNEDEIIKVLDLLKQHI
ncbi:PLP-dependent aminotransferase family protein [Limibacter armeniacum]|uniref:MocR-like pyridoxine biosynthesis transcription factor PdxR n=1 Tax=Limibacter armeniacum TaxID=466084 RepID=UPI002FE66941